MNRYCSTEGNFEGDDTSFQEVPDSTPPALLIIYHSYRVGDQTQMAFTHIFSDRR